MKLTCFIRYEIDPTQRAAFEEYSRRWLAVIPQCGGTVIGYFLPYEGTNYEAFGILSFPTMADYEAYRSRLKANPHGHLNFEFAKERGFILREERTFLECVEAAT